MDTEPSWPPAEAARDLAAVDAVLAAHAGAAAEERRAAVAEYFRNRYGTERGARVLVLFGRLAAYLTRHADELRDRGLLDIANGGSIEPRFLAVLLRALERGAAEETVAEVPAREVPDDAVEP